MPEPCWLVVSATPPSSDEAPLFEHSVSVLLPRGRFIQGACPEPCEGSRSAVDVGEESRHGALLTVTRWLSSRSRPDAVAGEMLGELAEAWFSLLARSWR